MHNEPLGRQASGGLVVYQEDLRIPLHTQQWNPDAEIQMDIMLSARFRPRGQSQESRIQIVDVVLSGNHQVNDGPQPHTQADAKDAT